LTWIRVTRVERRPFLAILTAVALFTDAGIAIGRFFARATILTWVIRTGTGRWLLARIASEAVNARTFKTHALTCRSNINTIYAIKPRSSGCT